MAKPRLTGAVDGLNVIEITDLTRYTAAVEAGQQKGWAYYFPYLLTRNRPGRSEILLTEDAGSICVFVRRMREAEPHLDLYLAPAPMNPAVLARCLERANDYNGDTSARVLRIDSKDADSASSLENLRIRPRKEQYIYDPKAYDELAGKRYRTLRRNVALIDAMEDVEVMPYSSSLHADGCRDLLNRWQANYQDVQGGKVSIGASTRAIDLAAVLPDVCMRGVVVFVNGCLSAFALGGQIRPGFACLYERKERRR